jgi:hypothetical protein
MMDFMNSSGNVAANESVARRVKKSKNGRRPRGRTKSGKSPSAANEYDVSMAAAGTLTRTKALLLAALRVWELKHRIHDR